MSIEITKSRLFVWIGGYWGAVISLSGVVSIFWGDCWIDPKSPAQCYAHLHAFMRTIWGVAAGLFVCVGLLLWRLDQQRRKRIGQ